MSYSCSEANPSLGPAKNWSDTCCFTCSFRRSFHLAAILIKQMQQISKHLKPGHVHLHSPQNSALLQNTHNKELLEGILHSQRHQVHTAFINFILCYNISVPKGGFCTEIFVIRIENNFSAALLWR